MTDEEREWLKLGRSLSKVAEMDYPKSIQGQQEYFASSLPAAQEKLECKLSEHSTSTLNALCDALSNVLKERGEISEEESDLEGF